MIISFLNLWKFMKINKAFFGTLDFPKSHNNKFKITFKISNFLKKIFYLKLNEAELE